MLSSEELKVLELIDELGRSSLSAADQKPQVLKIVQLIGELEDVREEQRILNIETSNFVDLAKMRLENAERESLANYDRSIEIKNKASKPLSQNTENEHVTKSDAELATGMGYTDAQFGDGNGGDALREAVHESKSSEITEVLFRMHRMAREEVLKGEQNIDELDMSSKSLTAITTKFNAVDVLLNGSKRLVKVLDEADRKDRRLMLASMGFLGAVLVYIIVRRILSGPLKLLLWTFFRLFGLAKWASKLYKPKTTAVESSVAAVTATLATSIGTLTTLLASVSTPLNNTAINETVNETVTKTLSEITRSTDYITDMHDADDVHDDVHDTHTESSDHAETDTFTALDYEDVAADIVEAHDDL